MKFELLQKQLEECLLPVQKKLRHRLNVVLRENRDIPGGLVREIERAHRLYRQRLETRPVVRFGNDLPIHSRLDDIRHAINENQVIVISGETGSGKTTQLPRLCLSMGRGSSGFIGHTQPRRLAARTVANRIAEELNVEPGTAVGYKIRHSDRTSESTFIKIMTDGILLAELQQDKKLFQYDTLIIDEAHERSLNIDFLLGYIKRLLPERPDLKVIITSATIDVQRFSEHFDNAPVVQVTGRTYPVEVRYRSPEMDIDDTDDGQSALHDAVRELIAEGPGDILIFMEGEREIHEARRFLEKQSFRDTDILPLYSRLSSSRQTRIYQPHKRRHIILATNVAETSLTIPGIRFVIDRGYARISRYSRRSKVQQLPVEKISRASADQRKGRCGRMSAGVCIRLYSEEDYETRPQYTDPEIIRTNLASVILQMKVLRLGDIHDFPFINQPDSRYINDGLRLLHEIRATDRAGDLTSLGRQLARLPLDPRLGCMLLEAGRLGCLAEVLVIVSGLSGQDPRERPLDMQEKADRAHAVFQDERSDFVSLLNIWKFYHQQDAKLSQNRMRKLCRQNFLSYVRLREWKDIQHQLQRILAGMGLHSQKEEADYDTIHMALVPGLLGNVACKTEENAYTGARGIRLHIFPGSGQFQKRPKWIMAAELVETTKLYARTVAAINPQWLLKPASHLVQSEVSAPSWDCASQQVIAQEKLGLYGLVLVTGQRVNYGRTNPEDARRIFIQEALVEEKLRTRAGFLSANHEVIENLRQQERKTRRHDIVNEQALFDFYDENLPADVYNGPQFEKWFGKAVQENPGLLRINESDIRYPAATALTADDYPDEVVLNRTVLPLSYEFEPSREDDGINLDIPVYMLNQVRPGQLDSLVPGILEEKITCMLKALPKPLRKRLVPVPDTARECAASIEPGDGLLGEHLASYLARTRQIEVDRDTWNNLEYPSHLAINIRVLDENNRVLARGRDLQELQQKLAGEITSQFKNVLPVSIEQDGYTDWEFPDLDEEVLHESGNLQVTSYPALVDKVNSVSVRLFDTRAAARASMPRGLRRLFMLSLHREYKKLARNLPDIDRIELLYASLGKSEHLVEDLLQVITDRVFLQPDANVRTQAEFARRREEGEKILYSEAVVVGSLVCEILEKWHQAVRFLRDNAENTGKEVNADLEEHIHSLVYAGFLHDVPASRLRHFPRYLDAAMKRIEKAAFSPDKDRKLQSEFRPFWQTCMGIMTSNPTVNNQQAMEQLRFMLEEFRVSLFAQELGTAIKISGKRLQKHMETLGAASGNSG